MSVRLCSALCSALTVAMPPKPPPTTRILLRAVLPIAIAPDLFKVTESGSTALTPSLLTRQELHVASAPQRDASRADLPETIHGAPRPRPGGVGGASAWPTSSVLSALLYRWREANVPRPRAYSAVGNKKG